MGWFFRRKPELVVQQHAGSDIATMADIHARSFSKPWNEADIARLVSGKGVQAMVARQAGRGSQGTCGFAMVRTVADEAEIITIAADPAMRRAGIGRALMGQIVRELQHQRIARLFLEVSAENTAALALYRSTGFRQVGLRKGYYTPPQMAGGQASQPAKAGGKAPDALVMELDLR